MPSVLTGRFSNTPRMSSEDLVDSQGGLTASSMTTSCGVNLTSRQRHLNLFKSDWAHLFFSGWKVYNSDGLCLNINEQHQNVLRLYTCLMWGVGDAVNGDLQPQPWHQVNIILLAASPNPNLGTRWGLTASAMTSGQHHFTCSFTQPKSWHSMGTYSLSHDIRSTSFYMQLHPTQILALTLLVVMR